MNLNNFFIFFLSLSINFAVLEHNQNLRIDGMSGYVLGTKATKKQKIDLVPLNQHPWFVPTWCYRVREHCKTYSLTNTHLSLYGIKTESSWLLYYDDVLTGIYAQFSQKNQNYKKISKTILDKYLQTKTYTVGGFQELYIKSVYIDLKFNSHSNMMKLEYTRKIKKILRKEIKTSKKWRSNLDLDLHQGVGFKNHIVGVK
ncbi:MAG: hypothetical protein COB02_07620 [Candidatus Cloacimonadota bacterium]|nr:MAG: hypothetical protein COB02_07620 [Candidatus Cloacimonadota bacterium]